MESPHNLCDMNLWLPRHTCVFATHVKGDPSKSPKDNHNIPHGLISFPCMYRQLVHTLDNRQNRSRMGVGLKEASSSSSDSVSFLLSHFPVSFLLSQFPVCFQLYQHTRGHWGQPLDSWKLRRVWLLWQLLSECDWTGHSLSCTCSDKETATAPSLPSPDCSLFVDHNNKRY